MSNTKVSRFIGVLVLAAFVWPLAALAATVKIGLIDFALRHNTLKAFNNVTVRSITFEMTDFTAARTQSFEFKRGHGDVMAAELIRAFQTVAPGNNLELFVASPFLENAVTGRQIIDFDQLEFAYSWFARQGVKVVAQTFVAQDHPTLQAAMDTATAQGLVVLTSAGNGPQQNAVPPYPASYTGAIGISTTGLRAELRKEPDRNTYVRYSVPAPKTSALKLRQDPELASLEGSSRATVAAAGLLGAMSTRFKISSRDDAILLLDTVAVPVEKYSSDAAYGKGVLVQDVVAQHLRAPGLVPELKKLLLNERASA